jgi:parallel beta-helix repeat protein
MRETANLGVLVSMCSALVLSACGGGGGNSSGPPPPNPLYVSARSGSDTNLGDQSHPLASVVKAAQLAQNGYNIIVAPGKYQGGVTTIAVGKAPQGLQFVADTSGAQTGSPAGPVVIDGTGFDAGFKLVNSDGTLIDGFTVIGTTTNNVGILIKSASDNFVVRNCIVHDNGDDGIRVQDSQNVLIFNNLIYNNSGHGIAMVGTPGFPNGQGSLNGHVISNTIYHNAGHGIQFGNSTVASPHGFVRNNIVENSGAENIKVFTIPRSDLNYSEDFDLVFPPTFFPTNPPIQHPDDITVDARFVSTSREDFHLKADSPAINAGDVLDPALTAQLTARTTTGETADNDGQLDLGYHFPQ